MNIPRYSLRTGTWQIHLITRHAVVELQLPLTVTDCVLALSQTKPSLND